MLNFAQHVFRSSKKGLFRQLKSQRFSSEPRMTRNLNYGVGLWLLGNSVLVFGIVLVGGFTRLTESGLSITEWNLIKGIKPPKDDEEWELEFNKYKKSPEYEQINSKMSLIEFKTIFYTEWAHRLYGRLIGTTFLLPAIYFWSKGAFSPALKKRILFYGSLLAFQGFLGWYMVKSGLSIESKEDVARVSQYRLASHLGTAFVLYTTMLYSSFGLLCPKGFETDKDIRKLRMPIHLTAGLVFLTAITGAFVAGLDAGLIYNEFPKMGKGLIPPTEELFEEKFSNQAWKNCFENPVLVQLIHRSMALTSFTAVAFLTLYSKTLRLPKIVNVGMNSLICLTTLQAALGISTLIYFVPTPLAVSHQGGSLSVLTCLVWLMHLLKKSPK